MITVFQWHWSDCSFFFNRGSGLTLVSPHHTTPVFSYFYPHRVPPPTLCPHPLHNPSPSQLSVYNQRGTRGFMGWTLTVISPNAGLLFSSDVSYIFVSRFVVNLPCVENELCWHIDRPTYLPDGGNLNYELILISDWDNWRYWPYDTGI